MFYEGLSGLLVIVIIAVLCAVAPTIVGIIIMSICIVSLPEIFNWISVWLSKNISNEKPWMNVESKK